MIDKSKEKYTLLKNTISLTFMQLSSYIFPLLTFPYLTRVLGPEKYSIVIFSTSVINYFQIVLDFGFILSSTKDISINRENKYLVSSIVFSTIFAKFLLAILSLLILLITILTIPLFSKNWNYLILLFISSVITLLIPDYLYRGIEKMNPITIRVIFSKIIYTLLVFLLIKSNNDYLLLPVLLIICNAISVSLTWIDIAQNNYLTPCRINKAQILDSLKKSFFFFISRIASTLYTSTNTVLLGIYDSNSLANYGVASTLINSIRSAFSPVSDSIFPYIIKNKDYKMVYKILMLLIPAVLILCVLLLIFSKSIIEIMSGYEYLGAIPIFRMMLYIVLITLPLYLFGHPMLGSINKINYANYSVIFASIIHLAMLITLLGIKKLNIYSITLLTCITESIVLASRIVAYFIYKREK